jgi:hypothetical protein
VAWRGAHPWFWAFAGLGACFYAVEDLAPRGDGGADDGSSTDAREDGAPPDATDAGGVDAKPLSDAPVLDEADVIVCTPTPEPSDAGDVTLDTCATGARMKSGCGPGLVPGILVTTTGGFKITVHGVDKHFIEPVGQTCQSLGGGSCASNDVTGTINPGGGAFIGYADGHCGTISFTLQP